MTHRQRRRVARCALLCGVIASVLASCGEDSPIPSLQIPQRGTGAAATPLPAPPPTHAPVAVECSPPLPERAGTPQGSDLSFSGPCNFTETARVQCSTQPDDFIFQLSRDTRDGPKLYLEVNIEFYRGPGTYRDNVHLLFEIQDNGTIYEWDTLNAAGTIDPGGRSGSFDNVALPPDAGTPSRGTLLVSGSFACA